MSATQDPQTVARWSVGGVFLESLANRNFDRLAETLAPEVRFRAMLPPGPMDWEGADTVSGVFGSWFGDAKDFELIDATVGEVGGRLHLSWRLRVRPAILDDISRPKRSGESSRRWRCTSISARKTSPAPPWDWC